VLGIHNFLDTEIYLIIIIIIAISRHHRTPECQDFRCFDRTVDTECHVTWLWPQRNVFSKTGDLFKTGIFRFGLIQLCWDSFCTMRDCAAGDWSLVSAIRQKGETECTRHAASVRCSSLAQKTFSKSGELCNYTELRGNFMRIRITGCSMLIPGWYGQSRIGWPRTFLTRH